jgi:hypothetical protein
MADLIIITVEHSLMWSGNELNCLVPKLSMANLNLSFDHCNPSLLEKRVSLVNFLGKSSLSMIGTRVLTSL